MSPMMDANLLSINGTVTNSQNGSALKIRGSGNEGLTMRFYIPASAGTTTTILPKVEASNNNSSWNLISQYVGGAQSWVATDPAKVLEVPFKTTRKYVRAVLTATGTTPAWGSVQAGVTAPVHADWDRSRDFSA